jgi:hypothetical protein
MVSIGRSVSALSADSARAMVELLSAKTTARLTLRSLVAAPKVGQDMMRNGSDDQEDMKNNISLHTFLDPDQIRRINRAA